MTSPTAARRAAKASHRHPFAPVMTFTDDGLVLGTTVLAPTGRDADGAREIAIDGVEERILALLAAAYGRTAGRNIFGNIRRAAKYWRRGEANLAEIEIALSGLPSLSKKQEAGARLVLGEQLLAAGVTPRELVKACGISPGALGFLKVRFNPDQPRVPAGNPDGGQWTDDGGDERPSGTDAASSSSASPHDQPASVAAERPLNLAPCFTAMRPCTPKPLRDIRPRRAKPTTQTNDSGGAAWDRALKIICKSNPRQRSEALGRRLCKRPRAIPADT